MKVVLLQTMGRILAIDFGTRRTGIAVTDELQLIASGLTTVETKHLMDFLQNYLKEEEVDCLVIGYPKQMNNEVSTSEEAIVKFIDQLTKELPELSVVRQDERFTSKMAFDAMLAGGMKKKDRRNKGNIDKVSAAIILQSYLESKQF